MDSADAGCFFHTVTDCKETVIKVTDKQWCTANEYAVRWVQIYGDAQKKAIAQKILNTQSNSDLLCHYACYKNFCNKLVIERAEVKQAKREQESTEEPSQKRTRSKAAAPTRRAGPLLPQTCVICQKQDKFISDTKTKKRRRDVLSQAQTITAGLLIETAKRRASTDGQKVLEFIGQNEDLVACEARYHKTCFKDFTRETYQQKAEPAAAESYDVTYNNYFKPRLIEEHVIKKGRIYRLASLARIFTDMVKKYEDPQAPDFPAVLMKRRLKRDFPSLIMQAPSRREGINVYHPNAVIHSSEEETDDVYTTDATTSSSTSSPIKLSRPARMETEQVSAYHTQLMLKNSIENHSYNMPWPLLSQHVDMESFMNSVPEELTKFVQTLIESRSGMPVPHSDKIRITSVCQDLISLVSKGKLSSPKALSLGLVVKHLTGSRELIDILHRLGHCASYDSVRRYETSLAMHTLSNTGNVPENFESGQTIILVWDNIDFLEATRTGHNTTHHTNGILLQPTFQGPVRPTQQVTQVRGSMKSLQPISETISPLPAHTRTNPIHLSGVGLPHKEDTLPTDALEFMYALLRRQEEYPKPSWTGFNKMVRKDLTSPKSQLLYLPVIEAAPTDVDVVNHILEKSLEQADRFGVEVAVVVFDQAIYSKAQTVRFLNPTLQSRLVPKLGEFHTVMTFLGVIGKRYGDAGFTKIVTESQCVAEGSMKGVLNGHSYNRSIMAHKLVMESLYDLCIDQFICTLESSAAVDSSSLDIARGVFTGQFKGDLSQEQSKLYEAFQNFLHVNSQDNPTFRFWAEYLELVTCLLSFLRATRESDWALHLKSLRRLLPWFFAYDHSNYARYGTLYYVEMSNLESSHPDIYDVFSKQRGYATYQSGHHRPFSSVACDMAIEQTVNRDTKSQGGMVGFTRQQSASQRWTLSHPQRTSVYTALQSMLSLGDTDPDKHGLTESAWTRDEETRCAIKEIITTRINPFTYTGKSLVSIVSGAEATLDVMKDLASAKEQGESQLQEFISKRIQSQEKDFNSAITATKSKTFSSMQVKTGKVQKKSLEQHGRLFDRLLVISQQRNVDLKKVMRYSLGNVSWSLATSEGGLMKTAKSSLMAAIEKDVEGNPSCHPEAKDLPNLDAVVIDGMAEIQSLKPPSTFGMVADVLLKRLAAIASSYHCPQIDFICDNYPDISIKSTERSRRSSKGKQKVTIFGPQQKVPKWSDFLAEGSNKEALVKFIYAQWCNVNIKQDLILFMAFGCGCHKITYSKEAATQQEDMEPMESDHEEADTRMLAHVRSIMECKGSEANVMIKCQDTDVFIICLALVHELPSQNLFFFCGKQQRMRYLNIGKISQVKSPAFCKGLLGLHAFTGCDSTSAFFSKGKKSFLNLMKQDTTYQDALSKLGTEFVVEEDTFKALEQMVCNIYNVETTDVNEARYYVYCSPSRTKQANLPPTKDELSLHSARAGYQAAVWRRACRFKIEAPSPTHHGWLIQDGELTIKWMTQPPAPPDVLQTMFCRCKTGCESKRCQCKKELLICTDMCSCINCKNCNSTEGEDKVDEIDSDDSESADL